MATIGCGGSIDTFGVKQSMSAPACEYSAVDVAFEEVAI